MAERHVKVQIPPNNEMVDGVEVAVDEALEKWSEVKLVDGSVIRVKLTVASAIRVEGRWDQDGNPLYIVRGAQTMVVSSTPDNLRKPTAQ
jgi:hypothetical protein